MTYGAECWTMKKKDGMLMNKTEMRMLRWIQGVSLREHKRNEEIREAATVQPIATHLMQKRLRWLRLVWTCQTERWMPYHQNSAGHGGRRCETARKTKITIHGHHQEGHQKECADGRQHSRPQELEIDSVQGDPLTWKSLQGEKVRNKDVWIVTNWEYKVETRQWKYIYLL